MQNEKIYVNIRPKPREIDRIINRYYARRGWRIISIVKGNGAFWATLELETEKKGYKQ